MQAPHHNPPGVYDALLQLLEEELEERKTARLIEKAGDASNAGRLHNKKCRSLADGYYLWAAYLFWLAEAMRAGAIFELQSSELTGLKSVKAARAEFERENPGCRSCGSPNNSFVLRCWNCGVQLREAA
jgi:hypothetical protein